jgi:hypothetical protein
VSIGKPAASWGKNYPKETHLLKKMWG